MSNNLSSKTERRRQGFLIFTMIVFCLALPLCSSFLGTFQQGKCLDIKTILNSSYVNISTISNPDSKVLISNRIMTKSGYTFNYTFCNTSLIGNYIYDYFDDGGNVYVNDFEITSTGNSQGNTIPIFLYIGGFLILGIGLWKRNPIIGFFSGAVFVIAFLYLMIFGLGSLWNEYTRMISYVTLGLGLVISFISMIELFYEGGSSEE